MPTRVAAAAKAYLASPDAAAVSALQRAVESPRQEFFRRLNLAPGATAQIVAMRRDLLERRRSGARLGRSRPDASAGVVVQPRLPGAAPHRLADAGRHPGKDHRTTRPCTRSRAGTTCAAASIPTDRRCFAFFHPSLIDEPLIFVEVALMRDIPDSIQSLLQEAPKNGDAEREADDGSVLLDLQLPGRPARHLVRQFPDQAGGRGPGEGARQPEDLRDALADAAVCRVARRARWPRTAGSLAHAVERERCAVLDDPAGSTPMARRP